MVSLNSTQINESFQPVNKNNSLIVNPSHHLSVIKLIENNYLTWKLQIINTVYGHSLKNRVLRRNTTRKENLEYNYNRKKYRSYRRKLGEEERRKFFRISRQSRINFLDEARSIIMFLAHGFDD